MDTNMLKNKNKNKNIQFKMKDIVKLYKKNKNFLMTLATDEYIEIIGKKGIKKRETRIINKILKCNLKVEELIDELFGN